jgi:hypothetical protein
MGGLLRFVRFDLCISFLHGLAGCTIRKLFDHE